MNNPFKTLKNAIFGKGQIPQKQPNPADDIAYNFQRLKYYNTVNDIPQIEEFINAYATAVDANAPSRWELMDIYKNIHNRDAHLKAKIRERVARIRNRMFRITDSNNLELEITKLFRKKWFSDFLYNAMMAKFYGYSLIEFSPSTKPFEFFISNFDRRQVVIDSSAIVKNYMSADYSGLWKGNATEKPNELYFYNTNKDIQKYFFEVRFDNDDFGLLEVIACICILKRHSWGSWDEFERLFGVPLRVAKTDTRDQKTLGKIDDFLERMSTSAYAIFPENTELQIVESKQSDTYNVFDKKIDKVDAQVSKLIMGSTLTSDTAANGNRSLGDIHIKTADEILQEDIIDIAFFGNLLEVSYP
jgi:phage gp29-like protein